MSHPLFMWPTTKTKNNKNTNGKPIMYFLQHTYMHLSSLDHRGACTRGKVGGYCSHALCKEK